MTMKTNIQFLTPCGLCCRVLHEISCVTKEFISKASLSKNLAWPLFSKEGVLPLFGPPQAER